MFSLSYLFVLMQGAAAAAAADSWASSPVHQQIPSWYLKPQKLQVGQAHHITSVTKSTILSTRKWLSMSSVSNINVLMLSNQLLDQLRSNRASLKPPQMQMLEQLENQFSLMQQNQQQVHARTLSHTPALAHACTLKRPLSHKHTHLRTHTPPHMHPHPHTHTHIPAHVR